MNNFINIDAIKGYMDAAIIKDKDSKRSVMGYKLLLADGPEAGTLNNIDLWLYQQRRQNIWLRLQNARSCIAGQCPEGIG